MEEKNKDNNAPVTEEKNKDKNVWRAIAVCEAVLVLVVLVVAAAFVLKRNDSTIVSKNQNPGQETAQPTTPVDNVKEKGQETANAPEQNSEEGTAQAPTETSAPVELLKNDGGISVAFREDTVWESGDSQFAQFTMVLENNLEEPIETWRYTLELKENEKLNSFWGCTREDDGDKVILVPVTYTAAIEPGATSDGVGIIFEWKKGSEFNVAGGEFEYSLPQEETEGEQLSVQPESGTPVANHGQLSVSGTDLVDEKGNKYQLKGVSTHGIAWFPDYVNKDGFKTLRDDYQVNVVRIAMYSAENNGYCTGGNQSELKALVNKGVQYATELGMYVIIDWHVLGDANPNTHKSEALKFFAEMSEKYSDNNNVIYEICNEPNGGTSWSDVKSYANDVIKEIRKNDKDAVIIVGTPTWSQDVDAAAADRLKDDDNVMYALHFYAATHKEGLRDKLKTAHDAGLPVFVSEFSICDASGNGGIDYDSASKWLEMIHDYNLSYVGWSLCNKAETSALLKNSCSKVSNFTKEDLSDTGKWLFESFSK